MIQLNQELTKKEKTINLKEVNKKMIKKINEELLKFMIEVIKKEDIKTLEDLKSIDQDSNLYNNLYPENLLIINSIDSEDEYERYYKEAILKVEEINKKEQEQLNKLKQIEEKLKQEKEAKENSKSLLEKAFEFGKRNKKALHINLKEGKDYDSIISTISIFLDKKFRRDYTSMNPTYKKDNKLYLYDPSTSVYESDKDLIEKILYMMDPSLTKKRVKDLIDILEIGAKELNEPNRYVVADKSGNVFNFNKLRENPDMEINDVRDLIEYDPEVRKKFNIVNKLNVKLLDNNGEAKKRMKKYLMDFSGNDKDVYKTITQSASIGIFAHNDPQKIFIFVGNGSNGKSLFLNTYKNLIGRLNVSSSKLSNIMNNRFTAAETIGKLVVVDDDTLKYMKGDSGILKTITSSGYILTELKGQNATENLIYATIYAGSNHQIIFSDKSFAMVRRIFEIPAKAEFNKDNRDPSLIPFLETEEALSAFLEILLEAYIDYTRTGEVFECKETIEYRNERLSSVNPAVSFLNEIIEDGNYSKFNRGLITIKGLYQEFVNYSKSEGIEDQFIQKMDTFKREVKNYTVELEDDNGKDIEIELFDIGTKRVERADDPNDPKKKNKSYLVSINELVVNQSLPF